MPKKINKKGKNKAIIYPKKYQPKKINLEELFPSKEKENDIILKKSKKNIEEIKIQNYIKRSCNSVDKLIKKISVLSLAENIIDSFKINNKNTSEDSEGNIEEEEINDEDKINNKDEYNSFSKFSDITKDINIIEDSFKNGAPYQIIYNNYIFKYQGKTQKIC